MSLTKSHTLTEEFDLRFYLKALEFTWVDSSYDDERIYYKDNYEVYIYDRGYIFIHISGMAYGEMCGFWKNGLFIVDADKDRCMELLKRVARKLKIQLLDTDETIESRYQSIKEKYILEETIAKELCKAKCKARHSDRFYIRPDGREYYIASDGKEYHIGNDEMDYYIDLDCDVDDFLDSF